MRTMTPYRVVPEFRLFMFRIHQFSSLSRIRVQLPLGLLLAVVIPYVIRIGLGTAGGPIPPVNASAVTATFSLIVGYYFLRNLAIFPGIKTAYYVAPCFFASNLIGIFGLFLLRIDYSRTVMVSSAIISILLYIGLFSIARRRTQITVAVLPFGDLEHLEDIPGINWRILSSPDDKLGDIGCVVADFRADLPDAWERRLSDYALNGVIVYHVKQLHEGLTGKVRIEHLSENSFGSLVPLAAYVKVKVIADIIVSLLVLPIVLPMMAIVAILVKLDSPGPVIFRQQRVGYRGTPFTVYKIRTMTDGHGGLDARRSAITVENDRRVTGIGRFLRRMRIDEVPQILNVLKGEMSWIGPRPEACSLAEWYEAELPFYRYRHVVRPGITGWAQVNQGHVSEVAEVREKLENDFYYIKFFSPWLDLLIVVRTISAVLTGFGSR